MALLVPLDQISAWLSVILIEICCSFLEYLMTNYTTNGLTKVRRLPSTYFPNNCWLIILAFDTGYKIFNLKNTYESVAKYDKHSGAENFIMIFMCAWNTCSRLSLLLHRASCRFTDYHTTNKCTNCMSFILNHFFKTLSLLLHVSIAYRLSSSGSTYSS